MNTIGTWNWWRSKRRDYNRWLVFAGLSAFMAYALLIFSFPKVIPDAEVTAFTILFQGVGYLIAIALANVFFFLGPISERLLKPVDPEHFRKITYGIGKWLSVALPFSIPAIVLYEIVNK
ncbi:hypothetical protein LOH54_08970 [Sulfurimonas sp. HSL-3221]|uniref:hypothetical protein n=1 Tax=Sulfurimonadaceae TaxID=2771471 RepID=UPI001E3D6D05|nr:hypothetical protein [Sulfurimonas sp. HSL-3221]UFS61788.1 hypothetical protein LOH54_08970 [Sulfurimonas sp. HSL-3221]